MNKFFDNIWALRITAMVLAVLFFVYAKSEQDNIQSSRPSNEVDIITQVPLEVYYDTENLIVTNLPQTVDVTIEGPMQIVLKTKLTKDFKVFIDLNEFLIGEHRVPIQHENFSPKLDVSLEPGFVDLIIEEKVTKEVRVDPEMNTGLIASDYQLKEMSVEPDTVLVTGAKSVVESIEYVKATVSAERNMKTAFQQEASVKVLDRNLNKLDVSINPDMVNVKVDISAVSKEVPLIIQRKGTLKQGVTINNLNLETKKVRVYGPKSVIDGITELVVEFDVSEIEKSGIYEVKLVTPTGATRLSSETIKVQANITTTQTEPVEIQNTDTDTDTNTNTDTDKEAEAGIETDHTSETNRESSEETETSDGDKRIKHNSD